ncbi:MAG: NAD-binding protein [Candidatus Aenigmarchaeota archaeon]|nr:NAD-binding protein [Candidatus Aenigmarchaeota archaeon]
MKQTTYQTLRELRTVLMIILLIIFSAALILSIYSGVDMQTAIGNVFVHVITAGTGGVLGNVFYVVLIFLALGMTFYMFEKVIILLSELRFRGLLMKMRISSLKGHYIVCGAGRVGKHVADKLKDGKRKVIIIENDCATAQELKRIGHTVILGDCTNEDNLQKAKIKTADGIVACTGEDSVNVFLVLTAKDLNSKIKVATRVNDLKAEAEFKRAGADIIVAPEITGGFELADKISKN